MANGKWIRENAQLVAGTLLPVAVVVFFLLATYIPRLLIDPPQHDFLFAGESFYPHRQSRWRFEIDVGPERKLRIRAFPEEQYRYGAFPEEQYLYARRERLFRYEHSNGNLREISLPLPETDDVPQAGLPVEIAEFRDQVIDSSRTAPDGYEFGEPRRRDRNLLMPFYHASRLAVSKNGAVVTVPRIEKFNWDSARFLGWVVTPEGL